MNGGMDGRMRAGERTVVALCLCAAAVGAFSGSGNAVFDAAAHACETFEVELRSSTASTAPACPMPQSAAALLSKAEAALKRGEVIGAERALDCAKRALSRGGEANSRYDIARLHGNLAYRREQFDRALPLYACAAERALEAGDREGYAKMLNNSAAA
jgi:hypothetical protein